ncbi:hypothetical protein [Citrobacter sedlakii]|uniref:hypothetical protein n=1 Tax=Citrobacter TaxID=544 RepID=UPI001901398D|nr:hypothetical protein [Citrobacter sedlakii]MBJ9889554.1 hypothetical protein [Citrobacter sedlakii]MCK8147483.1 hypothetical protein [Citrobacter sedlakii]
MIETLLNKLQNGSTILTLSQILCAMKCMRAITEDEIIRDGDRFLDILDILVESYSDSGIFEVDDNNRVLLDDFNSWLTELGKKHLIGKNKDNLLAYVNTFSATM